jgi:hypothetical protein
MERRRAGVPVPVSRRGARRPGRTRRPPRRAARPQTSGPWGPAASALLPLPCSCRKQYRAAWFPQRMMVKQRDQRDPENTWSSL